MKQINQLINFGSENLKKKSISSYQIDSEIILSKILKKSREKILISLEELISHKKFSSFKKLINRRAKREPVAYIVREKEFWSKNFLVNKDTLIPRPETELLVEKVIKYFKNKKVFILDIGTGSGCILISILKEIKKSKGIGIDISKNALEIAHKNSKRFGLTKRLKFFHRSIDKLWSFKFDLIVSNPPYIRRHEIKNLSEDIKKYEPRIALDGGKDGLDVIKKVIYKSSTNLKINGMLALEIGSGQYKKVSQILKLKGFREKFLVKDYQNNIRCIISVLKY